MKARNAEYDPDYYIKLALWAMEQKLDGKRLLADGTTSRLLLFNSKGERTNCNRFLAVELAILVHMNAILDGELMADGIYWVFDMPLCDRLVDPSTTWTDRQLALDAFISSQDFQWIRLLRSEVTTRRKRSLARSVFNGGHEGYVLKRTDSLYRFGTKSSNWLKVKNVRTVDAIVASFGTNKHNVQLEVYVGDERIPIGECSRYEGEAPRAQIGDVIEVEFLNAGDPEKPRLYQPHAKRIRNDEKDPDECTLDQLDGTYAKKLVLA